MPNIFKELEQLQQERQRGLIQEVLNKKQMIILDALDFKGSWNEFLNCFDDLTVDILNDSNFQDTILDIIIDSNSKEDAALRFKKLLVFCHTEIEQEMLKALPFWKRILYKIKH